VDLLAEYFLFLLMLEKEFLQLHHHLILLAQVVHQN